MRSRVGILIASVLVLLATGSSLARGASSTAHVLVTFAPGATASEREAALRAIGGVVDGEIGPLGVTRVALAADARAAALVIAHQPGVVAAEADGVARIALVPNDSFYLSDPFTGLGQWGLRTARVDRAWDIARGSPDVIVATIDTGVDPGHPDLLNGLVTPVKTMREGGFGCEAPTIDDNSHGTHVAGIVAATANNGTGIAGVASGVRVLSIKALDCTGAGAVSDVASGIVYAADHGARIVNVSLGTPDDSFTLRSAVKYAQDKGLLVTAAVGNCGSLTTRCSQLNEINYPAGYPGVLGVAATTNDDRRASFSTQAPFVSIAAPGDRIVSTTPTYSTYQSERGLAKNYAVFSGTSQASPFVAAVAALIFSANPKLTAEQVADRLKATADDLGAPGFDTSFGAGRVNALRALSAPGGTYGAVYDTAKVADSAPAGAPFTPTIKLTNTSNFTWIANSTVRVSYHWIDSTGAAVIWDGLRTQLPADLPINASIDLPVSVSTPSAPGRYTLRFDMVRDGVTWFSATGVPTADVLVLVTIGLGATYTPAVRTASIVTGAQTTLAVTVTNTGARAWRATGPEPVHLSYHWVAPSGWVLVWDGARATLPVDVAPGASVTVQLPLLPPPAPGGFLVRLDLVQEGVTWFSTQGVPTVDVAFNVMARAAGGRVDA